MTIACLVSYEAMHVPRYTGDQIDTRLYDSLVGQLAFWDAANAALAQLHGATVEMRLEALRERACVRIFVRVYAADPEAVRLDLPQVEALLPSEYGWRPHNPNEGALSMRRIARVVRQMEYVDLPFASPLLLQAEKTRRANAQSEVPSPEFLSRVAAGGGPKGNGLRRLPTLATSLLDLDREPYCLPLPGRVEEVKPRRRTLYDALLAAAPAAISICLHRIDESRLSKARLLALNWKRFIDPFASHLESAGFGNLADLRETVSRYFLPSSYLANLTIRTAATRDGDAVSVANVLAATLSGPRAFRVYPPSRDAEILALVLKDIDVPSDNWTATRRNLHLTGLLESLFIQNVSQPPADEIEDILDHLLLLPHVYTVREAQRLMALPVADEEGLPGVDSRFLPPFSRPSLLMQPVLDAVGRPASPPNGRIRVGMAASTRGALSDDGKPHAGRHWHALDGVELTKHALVVGSTGSGKTMATSFLALEASRIGTPIMVIEPVKTEYFDRLKTRVPSLYRLRLEGRLGNAQADDFLAFDPLRIQAGVTVARHASYLKSCFEAAFPLEPVIALLLENALLAYYTSPPRARGCGLSLFTRGGPEICRITAGSVYPSFRTFRRFVEKQFLRQEFARDRGQPHPNAKDFEDIFRRRFANLGDGLVGECFREADRLTLEDPEGNYDCFGRYLKFNTVVELDAVPDADQKSLLMAFLLTYLYERRQADDLLEREEADRSAHRPRLRHLLILEEAHRVLAAPVGAGMRADSVGQDAKAKAVGLFVDMLAEIRAYGQGLVIVEQIPTKIVPEAVKNTNLKIMLRLTAKDDRDYLGEAMNFTEAQKRFVTNLRATKGQGIDFVVFEEGIDRPLMLSLPLPIEAREGWLFDEFFEQGSRW